MALTIQGNVVVQAPCEEVYDLLLEPEVLRRVIGKIPGITLERLDRVSEDRFDAAATIGVAMVKGNYSGTIQVLERRPGEYLRLRGDGKGGGNFTSGEVQLTLMPQGEQTLMNYIGQGNINGQLASVGQRLVDTVGRQLTDQGAKAFAEEIAQLRREKMGLPTVEVPPSPLIVPDWVVVGAIASSLLVLLGIILRLRHQGQN